MIVNESLRKDVAELLFQSQKHLGHILLFHKDKFSGLCYLCIFITCLKDIFDIAHRSGHPGFSKYFELIQRSWFVKGLKKSLRSFILSARFYKQDGINPEDPYNLLIRLRSPVMPSLLILSWFY